MILMSDAGGGTSIANRTLTFTDSETPLTSATLASGTYRPTNLADAEPSGPDAFLAPAPTGPNASTLAALAASGANGTWSLYVNDDYPAVDGGSIAGWSLSFETGGDYASASGQLVFSPGVVSQPITITLVGDAMAELNEAFLVNLTGAVNANTIDAQGQVTIVNDDGPLISIDDVTQAEGTGGANSLTFTVTLSESTGVTVTTPPATARRPAAATTHLSAGP